MNNKKLIDTNLIIDFLIKNRIDINAFCMMCNISKETFADIMMKNITFDVLYSLQNVAKVMKVPFIRLYGLGEIY